MSGSATRRILVGDDNATHRSVTAALLRREGYEVDLAADGGEVVAAVAAGEYGLVLLDISMPGMNGLHAARRIRSLPPPRNRVPVVAMTTHAMPGDRERCLAAGMDDYLAKPVAPKDLLAAVERWLCSPAASAAPEPAPQPAADPIDDSALALLAEQTDASILPSLVGTYIAEVRSRGQRIAEALAAQDWQALERQAHALKSASRTFGAHRLAATLEALELACGLGDTAQAALLAQGVPALADSAVAALSARYRSGE